MLDGDEVVLHLVGKLFGAAERLVDRSCHIVAVGFSAGAGYARELSQLL